MIQEHGPIQMHSYIYMHRKTRPQSIVSIILPLQSLISTSSSVQRSLATLLILLFPGSQDPNIPTFDKKMLNVLLSFLLWTGGAQAAPLQVRQAGSADLTVVKVGPPLPFSQSRTPRARSFCAVNAVLIDSSQRWRKRSNRRSTPRHWTSSQRTISPKLVLMARQSLNKSRKSLLPH